METAKITIEPLRNAHQTANKMVVLVKKYYADIGTKAEWPLIRFFDYVKKLPYHPDPKNNEVISRPKFLMQPNWFARDCDDKSILLASWLEANKVPWKFVASSTKKNKVLHHVFVVAKMKNRNVVLDATYPKNTFGEVPHLEKVTRITPLTGWE